MSHALKNKKNIRNQREEEQQKAFWQPSASIETLRKRAEILQKIRNFFASRDIIEVETALLCHTSVTDPFIESIPVLMHKHRLRPSVCEQRYYLQTSPEYAMKRLLAAGSGSIYQVSKAFRQGEKGRLHNPEFSILEWYRVGFDHHELMNEVDALLQSILKTAKGERYSYADIFQKWLAINPHFISVEELQDIAIANNINVHHRIEDHEVKDHKIEDKDTWLNLLLSHCIEPELGKDKPCFIYDFPASQAALARIQQHKDGHFTADRFEVYYKGIELANGFYELQDAHEQRARFEAQLNFRKKQNFQLLPIDEYFLAALEHGLPECAGIALGLDRLVMLALGLTSIEEVISFAFDRV